MSSPAFSLSLDEFPGLLDWPITHEAHLGEEVVDTLRKALEPYADQDYIRPHQIQFQCNQLLNSSLIEGDERSAMAFADIALALGTWGRDTSDTVCPPQGEPEATVRSLLDKATRFRYLPSLYAFCLRRASEICQQEGVHDVALKLFLAGQELPLPAYPELNWVAFPVVDVAQDYPSRLPSTLHPLTTPPETLADARNGWRDGRWNPISPPQEALLRSLIDKHEAQPWADTIVAMAQNCIRFERVGGNNYPIGSGRFGGLPDVPLNWIWPNNLEFLAQFALEEIAPFDVNHALPSRGLLRIFAGSIWSGDINTCKIEWDETPREQLRRAACPPNYAVNGLDQADGSRPIIYSPIAVSPCRIISVESGPIYEYYENAGLLEDDYSDYVEDIQREFLPSHVLGWDHQLLGSYNDGQEEAHDARRVHSSEKEHDEHTERASDWTLLFKIDSNDDLGTHFSDVGTVYFMIRREDLAARRFDRIFVTLTCG